MRDVSGQCLLHIGVLSITDSHFKKPFNILKVYCSRNIYIPVGVIDIHTYMCAELGKQTRLAEFVHVHLQGNFAFRTVRPS